MLTKKYPESPLMQAQASPIDLNVGDATLARHPSHVREFKKQKKNKARVFEVGDPGQCSGSHKTLARWIFFFFFFHAKNPSSLPCLPLLHSHSKIKKNKFFHNSNNNHNSTHLISSKTLKSINQSINQTVSSLNSTTKPQHPIPLLPLRFSPASSKKEKRRSRSLFSLYGY